MLWCADMTGEEHRWLDCAARMAAAGKAAARDLYGTSSGRVVLGRGAGGDRTLELDRACETAILEVLEREAPYPYALVSEEAGVHGPADAPWRVVIDPLDGSLNAKRGLEPFCASIAVAHGGTLGDVRVGYIEDYTRERVFSAVAGSGLVSPAAGPPEAGDAGLVEIVLFEAGRPDRHHFRYHDLSSVGAVGCSRDMRLRQIGSLALSLCYVATGVADLLVAAVPSRSVDVAAGLLIVQEAGGGAVTLTGQDIQQQPLDLEKRSPFVAWRAGLEEDEVLYRTRQLRRELLDHAQ
jgi:myo-inositol-1(or 4)-monophosphatase